MVVTLFVFSASSAAVCTALHALVLPFSALLCPPPPARDSPPTQASARCPHSLRDASSFPADVVAMVPLLTFPYYLAPITWGTSICPHAFRQAESGRETPGGRDHVPNQLESQRLALCLTQWTMIKKSLINVY